MYHSVGEKVTLYSGTVTEAGQGSAFNVDGWLEGQVFVDITAASGDGKTITMVVQTGTEADDFYGTHTSIGTFTTTGKQAPTKIDNFGKWIRLAWSAVTGSFTFSVYGLFKS